MQVTVTPPVQVPGGTLDSKMQVPCADHQWSTIVLSAEQERRITYQALLRTLIAYKSSMGIKAMERYRAMLYEFANYREIDECVSRFDSTEPTSIRWNDL